jgi:UDP-N-acetylglucosamine 2-epimerase (non-hydrolysing)
LVVGARPNFIKAEPLVRESERYSGVELLLVHTGQHYDAALSENTFTDLGLRPPDRHLGVGSGTRAEQLARVLTGFQAVCAELKPDSVIVVGDVNSTLAAALVTQALGIHLSHVEAGLRSEDRTMPEEINRILTDSLSDLLFTPTEGANANLLREGIPDSKIHLVGNIMIDSLDRCLPLARDRRVYVKWGCEPREYAVLTVHRPSNVDSPQDLAKLVRIIRETSDRLPTIFSMHPRTKAALERFDLWTELQSLTRAFSLYPPLSYLDFLNLEANARLVLTDSGGIQEETTVLGVPCLTLRSNTERPITVSEGTNRLVGLDLPVVLREVDRVLHEPPPGSYRPPMWDGRTAERIMRIVTDLT